MEKKVIYISKPYIEKSVDRTRLCADIEWDQQKKQLYYEVNKEFEEGLCVERSDAFVSALIILAMENHCDIQCGAPLSAQFFYQLDTYYMPAMERYQGVGNKISIIAELESDMCFDARGVAAGASGGVDSFYTIIRHKNTGIIGQDLTHLLFNNVCTLDNNEERIRTWYDQKKVEIQKIAKALNLPLIDLYTNLYSFYPYPYTSFSYFFTPMYASCVLALQKLIRVYYQSSGVTLAEFDIMTHHDNAYFDVFNLACFSTENVIFYSTGVEKTRLEKIEYIAKEPVVQENLSVCATEVSGIGKLRDGKINCGRCTKCLRTLSELYVIDKVQEFEPSFEIEGFINSPQKSLAQMTCSNGREFYGEIIAGLKKQNKIGVEYYLWRLILAPIYHMKKKLRNSKWIRKIYYALNLDVKLNGFRDQGMYENFNKE